MATWAAKVTLSPGPPRRGAGSSSNRTSTSTQPAAWARDSPGRRPPHPAVPAASQALTGTATANRYSARTGGPARRARVARSPPGMLDPPESAEARLASCFRRTARHLPYRIDARLRRGGFGGLKSEAGTQAVSDHAQPGVRGSARLVGAAVGLGAQHGGAEGEQPGGEGEQQRHVTRAGVGQWAHLVARRHLVVGEADAGAVRPGDGQAQPADAGGAELDRGLEAPRGVGGGRERAQDLSGVLVEHREPQLGVWGQFAA